MKRTIKNISREESINRTYQLNRNHTILPNQRKTQSSIKGDSVV